MAQIKILQKLLTKVRLWYVSVEDQKTLVLRQQLVVQLCLASDAYSVILTTRKLSWPNERQKHA